MHILTQNIAFPDVEEADEEGLLAIGGDLSVARLLLAYRNGIFPWFNQDKVVLWWSPNPRFVLLPENLKVSKSMRRFLKHCRILELSLQHAQKQNAKGKQELGLLLT